MAYPVMHYQLTRDEAQSASKTASRIDPSDFAAKPSMACSKWAAGVKGTRNKARVDCPACLTTLKKRSFFTSDKQLETKTPEMANSHPANPEGGAPVLDGELAQPERPNVNAMREAIETQDEMEVGAPVESVLEDVKAEAAETETTVNTVETADGKTQIIINVAGKKKTLAFSNVATANAFIKGASAKFGKKFVVIAAPAIGGENQPVTSGKSDIDDGAPNFKEAGKDIKLNNEGRSDAAAKHPTFCECDACQHNEAHDKEYKKAGFSFAPSAIQSQVLEVIAPELQHELIDSPNVSNAPMPVEITGDPHTGQGQEGLGNHEELLPGALEDAFAGLTRIGYVSTSPAGGAMGRDGKPQVLEGTPFRKENDIRGPGFIDEFYQNYDAVPGAAFASLRHTAGADEKKQFGIFLKKVMGEVAATFIAAFKVTTKMPMNQIPGIGEIQLAQVEQPIASTFNIVNTGSRVKYLMDKLTDSEIQDAINDAFAQGAVWHEAKEGGFVYEVFVRAETIDTDSMILKYKFVTGTKEAE